MMKDKFRGCLVGGAVGDALGYAVEFVHNKWIREKYGEKGITEYELASSEKAIISDDTQMTLFTAEGLLLCQKELGKQATREDFKNYIWQAYKRWYKTQTTYKTSDETWLMTLPELYKRRAPGTTCLSALSTDVESTYEHPINNRKGCGGVMRVAPIGLFFDTKNRMLDEIDFMGADATIITHGHELGYIPSAAFVHIVNLALYHAEMSLVEIVEDALIKMTQLFPDAQYLEDFLDLMNRALYLAEENEEDLAAIKQLGEGWVAEEALAIAVFCAVKYENDFEKAMIASVNHSGDSDSTGAITGNILGAYLGYEAIPEKFITNLELRDEIIKMADMLWEHRV